MREPILGVPKQVHQRVAHPTVHPSARERALLTTIPPRLRPLEEVYRRSKPQECACESLNARFPLSACSDGTARSLQSRSLLSLHSYNAYLLGTRSPDRMGNGHFFPELGPSPPTMVILSALVPAELRNRVFVRCCTRPLPPGSLQVAEVVSN